MLSYDLDFALLMWLEYHRAGTRTATIIMDQKLLKASCSGCFNIKGSAQKFLSFRLVKMVLIITLFSCGFSVVDTTTRGE